MVILLLVILYTLCLIVIFDRLTAKSKIRLSRKEIGFAISFKVLMGILYGWVFQKYYKGDDTWMYFNDSLNEYNKLLFQTGAFFKEYLALDSFHKYPDFASNFRDFVENLKYNAVAKSLAFFNLLSFQNYYIDVVFFNVFSFSGAYLLFKLFVANSGSRRTIIYLSTFFIPPVVFWLSGIRGDGLLLLCIGMTMYYFHAWTQNGRERHLLFFILGLIGIFIFRFQFFLISVPFFIAWWLCSHFNWKPLAVFFSTLIISLLIFFGSTILSSSFNLPTLVVSKQHEFLQLKGNTVFKLNPLQPNVVSFLSTFPQAFTNVFLRPYPWEAKGILQWAACGETFLFWCTLLIAISRINRITNMSLACFVFFFSFCVYLFIGYTVPFPGAIVRYRIIPELLLFLVLIPCLPFKLKKISI